MLDPLPADADSWTVQEGVSFTILQNPLRTRIHVTGQGEKFYVPPHWHAAHDENHVVIERRVMVTQDGVRRVVGPEDGICFTRRGVVHSIESFPEEELILEEAATEPDDVRSTLLVPRSGIYHWMSRLNRRHFSSVI
jgi:mannose-6-phosphate isomerase-like protein (cupin superfamily)